MKTVETRREFIGKLAAAATLADLRPNRGTAAPISSPAGRPNFLVIMLDDVGRECLGCFGGESFPTPNIDRLAAGGLKFETCYSTPMCCPSRVALLTGKYSFRNYVAWDYIDPRDATFASVLRDAGYATGFAGKWHHDGWRLERPAIVTAGFDDYTTYDYEAVRVLFSDKNLGNAYWDLPLIENGRDQRVPNYYMQDYYVDFLDGFIRRNRTRPFLAHCCLDLCHRPFMQAATTDNHRWPGGPVPAAELGSKGRVENFAGMIAALDRIIGRLVGSLREAGVLENTIIVFTSDHGTDNIAEASTLRMRYRGRSVAGGKYLVTEAGVNVPLIISGRGISVGSHTDELVNSADIFPTLADLAGVADKTPSDLDGRSFRPVLTGGKAARSWVYSWGVMNEPHTSRTYQQPILTKTEQLHVLRDKRWKYFSDGTLYDLREDPFETAALRDHLSPEVRVARDHLAGELGRLRASRPALW